MYRNVVFYVTTLGLFSSSRALGEEAASSGSLDLSDSNFLIATRQKSKECWFYYGNYKNISSALRTYPATVPFLCLLWSLCLLGFTIVSIRFWILKAHTMHRVHALCCVVLYHWCITSLLLLHGRPWFLRYSPKTFLLSWVLLCTQC